MPNLISGMHREIKRLRELIKEYDMLPDGAGRFGAAMMIASIDKAEKSIESNDAVDMLKCYADLKKHTG